MGAKTRNFLSMPHCSMISHIAFIIVGTALMQSKVCCGSKTIEFSKNSTGVVLSVYVRNNITAENKLADWKNYSIQDIQIMVEVISKKFLRLTTMDVGAVADNLAYQENYTYNNSYSQVRAAEAVAKVNCKRREDNPDSKPIEMYVGIGTHSTVDQFQKETKLATESVKNANGIFSKTVTGIVLSLDNIAVNDTFAKETFPIFLKIYEAKKTMKIRLGVRRNCEDLETLNTPSNMFIMFSDFIICQFYTDSNQSEVADMLNFAYQKYNNTAKNVNSKIEVMLQLQISGNTSNALEMDHFGEWWRVVDKWARDNTVVVWMNEAIDNSWKEGTEAQLGWWKLIENNKTAVIDGYVEKVVCTKNNCREMTPITQAHIVPFTEKQTPTIPSTENQTPKIPSTENQTPTIPSTENQKPTITSTENQTSTIPSTENQTPTIPSTENQTSTIPSTENQTPTIPSTENQTPTIPSTENQTPAIPSTENQTPAIPSTENQTPTIPSTENQTPTISSTVKQTSTTTSPEAIASTTSPEAIASTTSSEERTPTPGILEEGTPTSSVPTSTPVPDSGAKGNTAYVTTSIVIIAIMTKIFTLP